MACGAAEGNRRRGRTRHRYHAGSGRPLSADCGRSVGVRTRPAIFLPARWKPRRLLALDRAAMDAGFQSQLLPHFVRSQQYSHQRTTGVSMLAVTRCTCSRWTNFSAGQQKTPATVIRGRGQTRWQAHSLQACLQGQSGNYRDWRSKLKVFSPAFTSAVSVVSALYLAGIVSLNCGPV